MSTIAVGGRPYEPQVVIERARKACGWFALIAAFSAVNSVLILAGAQISFVIGLGATQLVDAVLAVARQQAQPPVATVITAIGLVVNLGILGVIVAIWQLAKRGSIIAYIVGMVLYLLDTVIFLLVGDWFGAAFHVFFLAMLWGGYGFVRQRSSAEQALAQPEVSAEPQMSPV
jgi:hypothetical protein